MTSFLGARWFVGSHQVLPCEARRRRQPRPSPRAPRCALSRNRKGVMFHVPFTSVNGLLRISCGVRSGREAVTKREGPATWGQGVARGKGRGVGQGEREGMGGGMGQGEHEGRAAALGRPVRGKGAPRQGWWGPVAVGAVDGAPFPRTPWSGGATGWVGPASRAGRTWTAAAPGRLACSLDPLTPAQWPEQLGAATHRLCGSDAPERRMKEAGRRQQPAVGSRRRWGYWAWRAPPVVSSR